jgi:hypothetical protein
MYNFQNYGCLQGITKESAQFAVPLTFVLNFSKSSHTSILLLLFAFVCYLMMYQSVTRGVSDSSFVCFNPLTPELNPTTQRYLTRFFIGDFAS